MIKVEGSVIRAYLWALRRSSWCHYCDCRFYQHFCCAICCAICCGPTASHFHLYRDYLCCLFSLYMIQGRAAGWSLYRPYPVPSSSPWLNEHNIHVNAPQLALRSNYNYSLPEVDQSELETTTRMSLGRGHTSVQCKVWTRVWTLVIAPLTWVRLTTSSAFQSQKWQLIGTQSSSHRSSYER